MPDDPRLDELLDRYQDLLEEGKAVDLDELCSAHPELRPELDRRIAQLNKMGKILGDPSVSSLPPLSLSDDKTWVNQAVRESGPIDIPAPAGYIVLEPLGEGAMGIVYKARQVGLNRLVALKMILAGTRARAVDLARFHEEAQAIASLRHSNIVQVYETGEYRNQPFFSLEFCPGGTLSRYLHGEPQPPIAAAAMTEVLARAIHYAHTRGIVHRDLKPGNVLLSTEGGPADSDSSTLNGEALAAGVGHAPLPIPLSVLKITDFGLAKRVDDSSDKTQDGSVIGTPSYMAPEQAFGHTKLIGPTTDVHALGAMLYEFLTGRPPFKGSTVHETLEQVRHRNPVPVHDLQPRVPPDLETICLKCLEKDPKKRYDSAEALAEDLHSFRLRRPIKARPVGQLNRAWRWCRREPRIAGLTAGFVILCLIVTAILVRYATQLDTARELLKEHEQSKLAYLRMERVTAEAKASQEYDADVNAARRLRCDAPLGWTWEARTHIASAAKSLAPTRNKVKLRTELAATRTALDLRFDRVITDKMSPGAVAFAPDGRIAVAPQLISLISLRFVLIIDPRTNRELRLPFFPGLPTKEIVDRSTALAFTPDGKWLFLGLRGGRVIRWRLPAEGEGKPVRTAWQAHARDAVESLVISPDSKWLYTGGGDGLVKRWAVDGDDKPERVWSAGGKAPWHIRGMAYWTEPRKALVVIGSTGFRVLDPDLLSESVSVPVPLLAGSVGQFAALPQRRMLAVSRGGALEVAHWDMGVYAPGPRLRDPGLDVDGLAHTGNVDTLLFHPSGAWLASAAQTEGMVKFWCASTGQLRLAVPFADARIIGFSADGRWAAIGGDHKLSLYEVSGMADQCPLACRGMVISAIGMTKEGRLATIASRRASDHAAKGNTIATIWDESGRPLENIFQRTDTSLREPQRVIYCPEAGSTVFMCGDGSVLLREPSGKLRTAKLGQITDLAIDPEGQCWTIEDRNKIVRRPDGLTGKGETVVLGLPWAGRKELACLRAGPENVVVGSTNGYLRVLGLDGKLIRDCACFDKSNAELLIERSTIIQAADISRDGTLVAAATNEGRVWVYRLPGGEKLCDLRADASCINTVAFDGTGNWLAAGGQDATVRLWRRTGDSYLAYATLGRHGSGAVRQVLFSSDGKCLWVLNEKETMVRAWNLERLKEEFATTGLER